MGFIKLLKALVKVWSVLAILFGSTLMALSIGGAFQDHSPIMLVYMVTSFFTGFMILIPGFIGLFWKDVFVRDVAQ